MNRVNVLNDTHQSDQNGHTQAEPIQDDLRQLTEVSPHSDTLKPAGDPDLTRVIATILLQIQETLTALDDRVTQLHSQITPAAVPREWYSIADAAQQLGKAEFTVREWCRFKRVNAHKRECGRGGKREWMISRKELERIRNKGLLPADL
jgi:hypothetical protein